MSRQTKFYTLLFAASLVSGIIFSVASLNLMHNIEGFASAGLPIDPDQVAQSNGRARIAIASLGLSILALGVLTWQQRAAQRR